MSYRDVLKIFKLERELTDPETALLNTLRGMTDAERELLAETVGPVKAVKAAAKSAVKKFKRCDVCGVSRRAKHHQDVTQPDYHEFDEGTPKTTEKKSARASSLAEKVKGAVGGTRMTNDDDRDYEACVAVLDDNGGEMTCGRTGDDNVHHKRTDPNYHPFVSSSPAPTAPGQSSTNGDEVSSETGSDVVSSAVHGASGSG